MSESFVTLASFSNAAEARMVLNHLQEAGVPAFLSGEMTAGFMADLGSMGPQVSLHVAQSELKRARDIIAWLAEAVPLPDDWEGAEGGDPDMWTCPWCGEAIEDEEPLCPYCGLARP
jgi:hypothetical protein